MVDREQPRESRPYPAWTAWPVNWTAVWVGALTALVAALIIGLIATAVGAHEVGTAGRLADWHKFGIAALIFGVCGAFFANVAGGWVAGKIAGIRHAEPAMLHGAITWLVTIPLLVAFAALGAGGLFGAWSGGLAGTPAWATPAAASAPNAALIARNEALGAVLGILLGLMGAAIGGWMAAGEPMNFTHHRTREWRSASGSTTVRVRPTEA